MKINSDNELDSGSEDEDERPLLIVPETLEENGEQRAGEVVHCDLVAAGEGEAEDLAESTLGECGEEGTIGQAGVRYCDKGEVTPTTVGFGIRGLTRHFLAQLSE